MLIVLFTLVGSYAYADSNETSTDVDQKSREVLVREVEKLKTQVGDLKKKLVVKEKEVRRANDRADRSLEAGNVAVEQFHLEWRRVSELEDENAQLRKLLAVAREKAFGFSGD